MPTEAHDVGSVEGDVNNHGSKTTPLLREQTSHTAAHIEGLPPELLFYLSRFLDLASLIVLCTATCTRLRAIFSQFDRELLFLEPAHRLNLGEWREAARTLERYELGTQSYPYALRPCSPSHAQKISAEACHLSQAMTQLTRDESLIDLDLFQSIIKFLGPGGPASLRPDDHGAQPHGSSGMMTPEAAGPDRVSKVRCLHLTGWHGMAGAFLIQQLRSQPSLRQVTTIVKTERADNRIWEHAAADDRKSRLAERGEGLDSIYSPRVTASSWRHDPRLGILTPNGSGRAAELDFVKMIEFDKCTGTQIIVQVGRRRPRRHGQAYLRGEGLQMGYQGYCIDLMTSPTPMTDESTADAPSLSENVHPERSGSSGAERESEAVGVAVGSNANSAADNQSDELDNCRGKNVKRMHIILLGREEVGTEVGDREQHEEMFERSIVTCNLCKERIRF